MNETTCEMLQSVLTKNQVKHFRAEYGENVIIAEVRYDDTCGNGHNSFAITADIYEPHRQPHEPTTQNAKGKTVWLNSCGCQHDEVAKHFPHLAPFIKWHLTSSDGPMHYVANALYHAGHTQYKDAMDVKSLKTTIVYGALPDDAAMDLEAFMFHAGESKQHNENGADLLGAWLIDRRTALIEAFKRDVESLGFTY